MENFLNLFSQADQKSAYEVEQRKNTLKVSLWVILICGITLGITNFIFGYLMAGVTLLVVSAACLAALRLNQKGFYDAAAVIVSCLILLWMFLDQAEKSRLRIKKKETDLK